MIQKRKNILLYSLLLVSILVLILDRIAFEHYLYWTLWWYDIMMHFLGGFLVAGIALWIFIRFAKPSLNQVKHALYVAIATGIIIGLGWEYFEYLSGALLRQENIVGDTVLDLIMDTVGAVTVWFIVKKNSLLEHEEQQESYESR